MNSKQAVSLGPEEDAAPIGISPAHRHTLELVEKIAPLEVEVLIVGPTGVGKELYARLLHAKSQRHNRRFVAMNCGALPPELFENELFGHTVGAYTGAQRSSEGLVAEAESGTLFLDEVNSLPLACQVKLLRFLQFREYRKLGEPRLRRANVRVVAASNRNLSEEVEQGRFREDLYFRLRVVPLEIPPLKDRPEDIPVLASAFVEIFADRYHVEAVKFEENALEAMRQHDWPGNVRELENCVQMLTCLQFGRKVQARDLPFQPFEDQSAEIPERLYSLPFGEAKRELVTDFEKEYLKRALESSGGNVAKAARSSGKDRRAFFELMRKHSLERLNAAVTEEKLTEPQPKKKAGSETRLTDRRAASA